MNPTRPWTRASSYAFCERLARRAAGNFYHAFALLPREQRSATLAKRAAGTVARRVIAWSGAPRPTSLRHDAAEAILIGLWGVMALGWISAREARQAIA